MERWCWGGENGVVFLKLRRGRIIGGSCGNIAVGRSTSGEEVATKSGLRGFEGTGHVRSR
jgi:hypothetical protein